MESTKANAERPRDEPAEETKQVSFNEENKEEGEEGEECFETNWDQEVKKFDEMGLKEEVLRGIYAYGFKEPSPIQQKGILPVIQGKDSIAQAQSGTGKTGTFTIACL